MQLVRTQRFPIPANVYNFNEELLQSINRFGIRVFILVVTKKHIRSTFPNIVRTSSSSPTTSV